MLCESLEEYICRLLPAETRAAFEDHLADCSTCREAVAEEQELFDLVAHAAVLDSPPAVVLSPKIRPTETSQKKSFATALSCIALALVATVMLTSVRTTPINTATGGVVDSSNLAQPPVIELPESTPGISIPTDDPNIQIVLINAPPPPPEFDRL